MNASSPARLEFIQAVKSEAGSITSLAQRLNRDRSAVTRDVELLRQLGIPAVEDRTTLPLATERLAIRQRIAFTLLQARAGQPFAAWLG